MTSNFVKLCTAAFAGSLIGIAYERLPPASEWSATLPSMGKFMQSVHADSSLVPRGPRQNSDPDEVSESYRLPEVNPQLSAENLKHSAKFGLPTNDNIRVFDDFVLSYDRRLRSPVWVIEHLTPEKLAHRDKSTREKSKFQEDHTIHEYFRAKLADFKNSGYDRGHMAAAGNHKLSQSILDQTFSLSNISPQVPELNRGPWEKLETYIRFRANRAKNVYIVSGPLYLPMKARDGNLYVTYRVLGKNHVSVPTHYFKVFLVEEKNGTLSLEAFMMPNDGKIENSSLDNYRVLIDRLDTIERASGVIFFNQINRDKINTPKVLSSDFKEDRNQRNRDKK